MRIFLILGMLASFSFSSSWLSSNYLDNVPGEEYLGLTSGCDLAVFSSTLEKHPNSLSGIIVGNVAPGEECLESPKAKVGANTKLFSLSRTDKTSSWKFNYDTYLKLSNGANQYEVDRDSKKTLSLSSCGDILSSFWQQDTLWVAGKAGICRISSGTPSNQLISPIKAQSFAIVGGIIYALEENGSVSICNSTSCTDTTTLSSTLSPQTGFQVWQSLGQNVYMAIDDEGYLQIKKETSQASSLRSYKAFKSPIVWTEGVDIRVSFLDGEGNLITVNDQAVQLEKSILYSGTYWNKLGVESYLSPEWTTGLTGIVRLYSGKLEEHGSYHHLGSSGLTAFTLFPSASYASKTVLDVLWSTVGQRSNAVIKIIQHKTDSSWVYFTGAQLAGIESHQIAIDTLKGADGNYKFSVILEQEDLSSGDTLSDSLSLNFVLDRTAPLGDLAWSLEKATSELLLVDTSLVLSPAQKLKVNLDSVFDALPFSGGEVDLNITLSEVGGNYKYEYVIKKSEVSSFKLQGLSAAGFPIKQGFYSIGWHLTDSLGNSSDTLASVSIGNTSYSNFAVGARAPIIKGNITPFLIDSLSAYKAQLSVEVIGLVDNSYDFELKLDTGDVRTNLPSSITTYPSQILLDKDGKYKQKFILDLNSLSYRGTASIVLRLKDSFGKWIEYPVPFAKDEVKTKIITPTQNELLSERTSIRGVVASPKLAQEDFLGYRSYYTKGTASLGSKLTLAQLMGSANWKPIVLPLSNQSINLDKRTFYNGIDRIYPKSNLGRSDFTQEALLGFFTPEVPTDTGVYTLVLVSEFLKEGKFKIEYDWKNVIWKGDGKGSHSYNFSVSHDTTILNISDSSDILFSLNSNVDGRVYMNLAKVNVEGTPTNIVLVKEFSLLKNTESQWVFDGKNEAFERFLSNGSYKALFHFVPTETIYSDSLVQNAFLLTGNSYSDSLSILSATPKRVEWIEGDTLKRGVDIKVRLENPTDFQLIVSKVVGDSILKVRDFGTFFSADEELYWDLKDSAALEPNFSGLDSLTYLVSLLDKAGELISSKEVVLSLKSGTLVTTSSVLIADDTSSSGFWLPEIEDRFRFLAKAQGPISYYPLKNVEVANVRILGKQAQRIFYDVPWQLNVRKYYNSIDVAANYYYNFKGVAITFWGDKNHWTSGMDQSKYGRYSFYNNESRFSDISITTSDSLYEKCLDDNGEASCFYGDADLITNPSRHTNSKQRRVTGDNGLLNSNLLKLLKLDTNYLNKKDGEFYCKGKNGQDYSDRYNHIAKDFCDGSSSYSSADPVLSDFNHQNIQWDAGYGMDPEMLFVVSDVLRIGDKSGDDTWRGRLDNAYLNVYLLSRQSCNSDLMSHKLADRVRTGDTVLTRIIGNTPGTLGPLIYANSLSNSGSFPDKGEHFERTIEVNEKLYSNSCIRNSPGWTDEGKYYHCGFNSRDPRITGWWDNDANYRAEFMKRPTIDWKDGYLNREDTTVFRNLNQVYLWKHPTYLSKIPDPVAWDLTSTTGSCVDSTVVIKGKEETRTFCDGTPGGSKMGVAGFSFRPLTQVPYNANDRGDNKGMIPLREVLSNFYDRSKDSGLVFFGNKPYQIDSVLHEGSNKDYYIHYKCEENTNPYYKTEELGFNPKLLIDTSTLGYVWDTLSIAFPFTKVTAEGPKLGVYPENPSLTVAFTAAAGLSWMVKEEDSLLTRVMGRQFSSNGHYVDSQRIYLDSSRFVDFWKSLKPKDSVPDSLYNYIQRDSLTFTLDLKVGKEDSDSLENVTDTINSAIYGKVFMDPTHDTIIVDLFYLDKPEVFNWSSQRDTAFHATNGYLPGRGLLYPNGFRGSDSALGESGFIGVIQSGKIDVPNFTTPDGTRELYSSLAPFVKVDGNLQYNPSISLDSLTWDVQAFYDDGVTSLAGLNILASDSGNLMVNLEPDQGFHQFLSLILKDSFPSVQTVGGSDYSFDYYTLSYLELDKSADERRITPIPVNSFYRKDGSLFKGSKPDLLLDLWANDSNQAEVGSWDVTSLVGPKLLVVDRYYKSASDVQVLRSTQSVMLGKAALSDSAEVSVESPGKRAQLLVPGGLLKEGEAVSIHSLSPEELPLKGDYPDVIPVGPVLSIESSGANKFDNVMPQITFKYTARDLYKMNGKESEYLADGITTEQIISYLNTIKSSYRLYVLSKSGVDFDAIPTTQSIVTSNDPDGILLTLTGDVPHFSYVFVLEGDQHIPIIRYIRELGDSLKVSGLVSKDTTGMVQPYELELIVSQKGTLKNIKTSDITFRDSLQTTSINFHFSMDISAWQEGQYFVYVRQKDATSSAKEAFTLADSIQRIWDMSELPNPVVPKCDTKAHELRFKAKWPQEMTRLIKDSTELIVFRDVVHIQKGPNTLTFDGCSQNSALEVGTYSYELRDSSKVWLGFSIGVGSALNKIQTVFVTPDTLILSPSVYASGSQIFIEGKGLTSLASSSILNIYNSSGVRVYQNQLWTNVSDTSAQQFWNGLDSLGVPLNTGLYQIRVDVNGNQLSTYIYIKEPMNPLVSSVLIAPDTSYFPLKGANLSVNVNQDVKIKIEAVSSAARTWILGDSVTSLDLRAGSSIKKIEWQDSTLMLPDSISIWFETLEGYKEVQTLAWNLYAQYPAVVITDILPSNTIWPGYILSEEKVSKRYPSSWFMNLQVKEAGRAVVKISQKGLVVFKDSITLEVGSFNWRWNGVDSLNQFMEGNVSIDLELISSHPLSASRVLPIKSTLNLEIFPEVLLVVDTNDVSMFEYANNLEGTLRTVFDVKSVHLLSEEEAYGFMSHHDKGLVVFLESNS
ncbi:hypothetical protein OAA91_00955, partial [Fibrobacterales bacterium]|nr:hypothetical protein [Fibrobacterales bacterium]